MAIQLFYCIFIRDILSEANQNFTAILFVIYYLKQFSRKNSNLPLVHCQSKRKFFTILIIASNCHALVHLSLQYPLYREGRASNSSRLSCHDSDLLSLPLFCLGEFPSDSINVINSSRSGLSDRSFPFAFLDIPVASIACLESLF